MTAMNEMLPQVRQDLIHRLLKKPFEPFAIVTVDGRRHEVVRQFQAAVGERRVVMLLAGGGASERFTLDDIQSLASAQHS
jgi:hypothetical protein